MHWWKWVGVAAFAGVAATGVVLARSERRQRHYSAEEIRERLHMRAAEAFDEGGDPAAPGAPVPAVPPVVGSAAAASNGSDDGEQRSGG